MIAVIGFNLTASAQKAINSVHFYDVKNAALEKTYIASIKEINAIMIEIGFPNNYYTYMKLNESDTTSTYRSCTIGHWTSEKDYKAILEQINTLNSNLRVMIEQNNQNKQNNVTSHRSRRTQILHTVTFDWLDKK